MATYLALINFTQQGVKDIKDTCKRAVDFKASVNKLGVEIRETYWCMGAHDGLIVFDAPDDETATAGMLSLAALNNVTTQTLRSFTTAEMTKILGKVM